MDSPALKHRMDALPASFFITDMAAGIVYANHAVEAKSGYPSPQAIGRKPQELWGGHMDGGFYHAMWRTLLETGRFVGDVENRKKDGSRVSERIHVAMVKDHGSDRQYFFAINPLTPDDRFSTEFFSRMDARFTHTDDVIAWMLKRLSSVYQFQATGRPLSRVFTDELVVPTETRYASRAEDRVLVMQAKEDPRAFGALYEKYYDTLFRYFVHRVNGVSSVAHDLIQDTFLRAFRALPHFELKNASYGTYVERIAHNVLVNYYRAEHSPAHEDPDAALFDVQPHVDGLLLKEDVWGAVAVLSQIEQDVVTMKYREGYSVREIAGMLQKTENAVKLHLSRARKKLKSLLESDG